MSCLLHGFVQDLLAVSLRVHESCTSICVQASILVRCSKMWFFITKKKVENRPVQFVFSNLCSLCGKFRLLNLLLFLGLR